RHRDHRHRRRPGPAFRATLSLPFLYAWRRPGGVAASRSACSQFDFNVMTLSRGCPAKITVIKLTKQGPISCSLDPGLGQARALARGMGWAASIIAPLRWNSPGNSGIVPAMAMPEFRPLD